MLRKIIKHLTKYTQETKVVQHNIHPESPAAHIFIPGVLGRCVCPSNETADWRSPVTMVTPLLFLRHYTPGPMVVCRYSQGARYCTIVETDNAVLLAYETLTVPPPSRPLY